jgi:hypothetical protein
LAQARPTRGDNPLASEEDELAASRSDILTVEGVDGSRPPQANVPMIMNLKRKNPGTPGPGWFETVTEDNRGKQHTVIRKDH